MNTLQIAAQPRETGKKATKAVRRNGLVPCVLYSQSIAPVHFAVEPLSLRPLIHTSESYRITMDVGGNSYDCILQDVDFHPITDEPMHADFRALTEGEKVTLGVPVTLRGDAIGVKEGGELVQPLYEIDVRCLPKDIPSRILVDISVLSIGDAVHVSDLDLGDEIEVLIDPTRTVVTVSTRTEEELPEPDAAALPLGEEGELPEGELPEGEEGELPEGEDGAEPEDTED